jgi:hypothetical protein
MIRKPTYSGNVNEKDQNDIDYWASKSPQERLKEAWRLHCMNHNISFDHKLNKARNKASKRHL